MRIEIPKLSDRLGSNMFYGIQKIYELDGGTHIDPEFDSPFHVIRQTDPEQIQAIERDMAIVIPVKNERLRVLEGVLCGIPHHCIPIIVSGSDRSPVDRFTMEQRMIDAFCNYAKKAYVCVHQQSEIIAQAFTNAGYKYLLDDENGLVRPGKAEGMIVGLLLARLLGKKYIGYIDADNYFPGSVLEYVRIFSAGLSQGVSPFKMVRIQWHSKPKIDGDELFFARWGRVSRITNQFLNQLMACFTGFETDALKTANAGEHAMSMELAMALDYSSGFSIETYHFINLFEKFGGILPGGTSEFLAKGVEIFQIESRNPHFHDIEKGTSHLNGMIESSLSVIYHTPLCPEALKKEIQDFLYQTGITQQKCAPCLPTCYPAMEGINVALAQKKMDWAAISNLSFK